MRKLGALAAVAMTVMLAGCSSSAAPKTTLATLATGTSTTSTTTVADEVAGGCGAHFFTQRDEALITHWFGGTQFCFLSAKTWLDVMSYEVPPQGPGGPVVLVDRCASDDATCLDPNLTHSLRDFTVYPAPDANTALTVITLLGTGLPGCRENCFVAAQGGTLVVITDGRCGTGVFDLKTGRWYSDAIASANQLMRGNPRAAFLIPSSPSYPANQPPPKLSPPPAVCHFTQ